MSDSDSSELSSVPSDDEQDLTLEKRDGILKFFSRAAPVASPKSEEEAPRPKRSPSPPHEYVLADNPDIAFIVMFRARFADAFPKSLANFGPQEIERGIVDSIPGEHVENLLCAVLGLLLNRKQDVKRGHYNRALEEALSTHRSQWPKKWVENPLSGGRTFHTMTPEERLTLLRTLILWSLSSSDAIKGMIQSSYKQNRQEDDLNQPLSVQPWGSDSEKRRYFLIEGLDDTCFRVYRESNPAGLKRTWMSVAGDIPELQALAEKLNTKDSGQKARLLAAKILSAIPRFEATEEKRKRREYRQMRKQQFKRTEPSFSLYEGRTRGKRIKYTYSDEEDEYSDLGSRRSTRNTGTHTPAEPAGPVVTASGRQVRARVGGTYGESLLSGAHEEADDEDYAMEEQGIEGEDASGRPRRAATGSRGANGYQAGGYNSVDEMEDEDEADASEQDYGDDEEDGDIELDSDDEDTGPLSAEDLDLAESASKKSLVVKLNIKTPTPEKERTVNKLTEEIKQDNGSIIEQAKEQSTEGTVLSKNTEDVKAHHPPSSPTPAPTSLPAPASNPALSSELTFRGSPEKTQLYRPPTETTVTEL